jgi:hypothetical protein
MLSTVAVVGRSSCARVGKYGAGDDGALRTDDASKVLRPNWFLGAAGGIEHRPGEIGKGARLAGAQIIDAIDLRTGDKPGHDIGHVADIDEVPGLATVGNTVTVRLEQLDALALADLGPDLVDD